MGEAITSFSDLSDNQQCVNVLHLSNSYNLTPFLSFTRTCLMQALCTLHSVGVSHNDLHPGNIVVGREREIWIVDFSHAGIHVCSGEDSCPELLFMKEAFACQVTL